MPEWQVVIEVDGELSDRQLSQVSRGLSAGVGFAGAHRFGVAFSVETRSTSAVRAAAVGERVFFDAVAAATGSAGSFPVLSVEVKTAAALDAELARPRYPEMVGVAEVAAMLGVSRQRVSVLLRNHRRFPPPIAEIAAGPVWTKDSVARFVESWDRRPGRKRNEADAAPR